MLARSRGRLLGVAVMLGLAAAGLTAFYMTRITEAADPVERVVVAKMNIPARAKITEDMLTYQQVPRGARHPEAMSTAQPFVGKVTKQSITAGEQILITKFFQERRESGLAFVIPEGKRAVAVKVDEHTGAGGLIAAGDKVDILGSCNVNLKEKDQVGTTTTITKDAFALQNIEVLAVAQKIVCEEAQSPLSALQSKKDAAALSEPKTASQAPTAKTITLALTMQQAQSVVLLEENQSCGIRLVLRASGDAAIQSLPEAVLNPNLPLLGQLQ